jgi:hypothetical protein
MMLDARANKNQRNIEEESHREGGGEGGGGGKVSSSSRVVDNSTTTRLLEKKKNSTTKQGEIGKEPGVNKVPTVSAATTTPNNKDEDPTLLPNTGWQTDTMTTSVTDTTTTLTPPPSPPTGTTTDTTTTTTNANIHTHANTVQSPLLPTTATTKTTTTTTTRKKTVQFDTIQVREYPYELGDSIPSCGVPVGISWMYTLVVTAPLCEYEAYKTGHSRKGPQMLLPSTQRTNLYVRASKRYSHLQTHTHTHKRKATDQGSEWHTLLD